MTIGELTYSLGAQWDKGSLNEIKNGFASVSKSFASSVALASGAMAGTFALVQQFASANDELGKMARNRDIAVDSMQALQYSFEGAGLDGSKVGDVLAKLQEQKEGFKTGKADFYALDRLQINPQAFKDNEEFFHAVLDGLKGITDESEKADLAKRLLGSSDMKNLIDGGSEAIRKQKKELAEMGVLISDQDYQESADFNDTLLKTMTMLKGIASKVMTSIMPIFSKLMKQFNAFLQANRDLLHSGLKQFLRAIIDGSKFFLSLIGRIIGHLGGMKTVITVIAGLLLFWQMPLIASIALIVGLMLAFDDVMNFLSGKESVLSDWLGVKDIEEFKKKFPALTDMFSNMADVVKMVAEGWSLIFTDGDKAIEGLGILIDRWLINPIKEVISYIEEMINSFVQAKNAIAEGFSGFGSSVLDFVGMGGSEQAGKSATPATQTSTTTTANTYHITATVDAKNKTVGEALTELSHPNGY